MAKQYLEAGEIVNTHGIRGEVKINPWADGPEFLVDFDTLYLNGTAYEVTYTEIDHGPRLGVTKIRTLDPCITPEAKARRREVLRQTCLDLIRQGLA